MFFKYLKEIFIHNFGFSNRLVSGLTYLLFISTLLTTVLGYKADWVHDIEPTIFFLAAKLTGFALLVWAPFSVWKDEYLKNAASLGTESDLQFLPMDTYYEQKTPSKERVVLPVKIKNESNTETVESVRVKVVRVKTDDQFYERNIDLISENSGESSMAIDPNDSEVFRFGRCKPSGTLSGIFLAPEFGNSANRQGKYHLPNGVHEVELRATGKNTKPCTAIYTLKLEQGKSPEFYRTPEKSLRKKRAE